MLRIARSKLIWIFSSNKRCNYKITDCSCALAGQTSGAFGLALIFLVLFASRQKEQKSVKINIMFFLLLVQKKERKKSTPAMIYSHCRTPWFNFSATVNYTKQFLSSTSTIVEMCFFHKSLFIVIKREIISAFFFVYYRSIPFLKNANEKDSAFRCFE